MKQIATYLSFCAILLSVPSNAQASDLTRNIYINEVMQSTFGGQYDMLNEYPDGWVELYNPSDNQVSLKDYRIGKKNKFSKCFILPDIKVSPKGHVVIFCDKADSVITVNGTVMEIHADFRITTDVVSSLYLFNTNQVLSDTIGLPVMPAPNIAFGRFSDGVDSLGWELKPTMGMTNEGGFGKKILPEPLFLSNSVISSDGQGTSSRQIRAYKDRRWPLDYTVRYTLDGTEPNESSPKMSETLYLSTNTILKAAVFADSCISRPAVTKILLFNGHPMSLPVVSLCASDEDLNSDAHGIIKNNNSSDENLRFNWRRPAIFDYFSESSETFRVADISQRCEIRVGGAYTRTNKLKTIIVYSDKRFGTKDYFSAQFWPSNRPEVKESKSIALRSSGNDFGESYMRDGAAQLVIGKNADIDWQGFQPAIYYINAKYQGIINIRERGNEDNIWAHYDKLEDLTLIENNELKQGEYSQFQDFVSFYSDNTHTYQEFDSVMDIEEYMNLMIINSFMANTDFPGNNNVLWRPIADGGKWRWILKDVDRAFNIWGMGPADHEYLNWVLRVEPFQDADWANSEDATRLFRNLMAIDEFKQKFIDRYTVYLGDFLRSNEINAVLTWCHDEMAPEWDYFAAAQSMKTKTSWESTISTMKTWSNSRTPFMRSYLKSFYSLGAEMPTTVGVGDSDASNFNITINDVPLTKGVFDGSLYCGRNYQLKGDYDDTQYTIVAWDVTVTLNTGQSSTERVMSEVLEITPNQSMKKISIKAVKGVNGIESSQADGAVLVRTIYTNTQGISSDEPFDGINIIRYIMEDGSSYTEKKLIRK